MMARVLSVLFLFFALALPATAQESLSQRVSDTTGNSVAFTTFGATPTGTRNMITSVLVYNSSATPGYVDLRDGTGGAVIATIPAPANSGTTTFFPIPLRQPTAATALAYDVSAAITTVYITVVGYKAAP